MKNIIFSFIICGIVLVSAFSFAQEKNEDVLSFKNPFVSLLPKKEIAKAEIKVTPEIKAQPIPEKEIVAPKLLVNGLVWNSKKPQAIVNDQVVGIGDKISEATVIGINSDGIEILFEGRHFAIGLVEEKSGQPTLRQQAPEEIRRRL